MYLALVAVIIGQALILGQLVLLAYAVAVLIAVATFVHTYEQPALSEQFGSQYAEYCRAVRAWWPRHRPWTPGDEHPATTATALAATADTGAMSTDPRERAHPSTKWRAPNAADRH